jgi:DNA uptake protein ComE-like DNA-binding protein
MWKDFFYFSQRERLALLALIVLIVLSQILLWTSQYWLPLLPGEAGREMAVQKELTHFRDTLQGESGAFHRNWKRTSGYRKAEIRLAAFNPNTADSATFVGLGLRPYVAKNILKYRRKGGTFRKPEDFARIYGISPEQFKKLAPYIRLADKQDATTNPIDSKNSDVAFASPASVNANPKKNVTNPGSAPASQMGGLSSVETSQAYASLHALDLNTADTALLQQLKGVGSVTANRIARYRNQLGGFYSLKQLEEIKGLYPETLARLQTLLQADPTKIARLNANKASLEKLRAHPYISFYQAKVILELRKARGSIRTISELSEFKEFTTEDLEKLKWYLSF